MSHCKNISTCNHSNCHTPTSVSQTLDELEFERGIWYPAQTGDIERVTKLLNERNCANAIDGAGYTALHYASRNGHLAICKLLLSHHTDINATTKSGGATALHRACSAGQTKIVELLLKSKANCKVIDNDGKNALHRAAAAQNLEICKLVVQSCPELKTQLDKKEKLPVNYAMSPELIALLD